MLKKLLMLQEAKRKEEAFDRYINSKAEADNILEEIKKHLKNLDYKFIKKHIPAKHVLSYIFELDVYKQYEMMKAEEKDIITRVVVHYASPGAKHPDSGVILDSWLIVVVNEYR